MIGWTTHGHNGETVPVWVHGGNAPVGVIDNTRLAYMAAEAMGVNLARVSRRLYVDLDEVTDAYQIVGDATLGKYGLVNNLVLKIERAEFLIGKDYMTYNN